MKQNISAVLILIVAGVFVTGCLSQREKEEMSQPRPFDYGKRKSHEDSTKTPVLPELTDTATLSDYLVYAALNNPGLEAAFDRFKAALERIPQVSAYPDPRFNYAYFIREVETRTGPQRESFSLSQTFPWFGKLDLRGDIAGLEAQAQRERYEDEKRKVFFEVKDAYYEYYYLGQAIAVTRENLQLLITLEEVIRTKFKAGIAPHAAVITFQVEIGKVGDLLRSVEDLHDPILARLNAAMNRPIHDDLPWPQTAPQEKVDLVVEQLVATIKENNPELQALQYTIEKEKTSIELAGKDFYPDLSFGAGYVDTGDSVTPQSDGGTDPISLTLSINVPIWREKYRAGENEARYRFHSALNHLTDRKNDLLVDLKLALYNFRDAERKIDLYQNALIPKANQSLQVTQQEFLAGETKFLDLIDIIRTLLDFNLAYERALANRGQSLARIEKLVGRDQWSENRTRTTSDNNDKDVK